MKVVDGFLNKFSILKELQKKFDWSLFEKEFKPTESSTIWKIFLLHIISPNELPIFDQHVFRFYHFNLYDEINEMPLSNKKVYKIYKEEYLSWFNKIKKDFNLNPKKMDESFFTFGQFLKKIKNYPFKIITQP